MEPAADADLSRQAARIALWFLLIGGVVWLVGQAVSRRMSEGDEHSPDFTLVTFMRGRRRSSVALGEDRRLAGRQRHRPAQGDTRSGRSRTHAEDSTRRVEGDCARRLVGRRRLGDETRGRPGQRDTSGRAARRRAPSPCSTINPRRRRSRDNGSVAAVRGGDDEPPKPRGRGELPRHRRIPRRRGACTPRVPWPAVRLAALCRKPRPRNKGGLEPPTPSLPWRGSWLYRRVCGASSWEPSSWKRVVLAP